MSEEVGMGSVSGKLKKWDEDRGFGFIKRDDKAADCFVHIRSINESGVEGPIEEGDCFLFEVEQGPKGPRAINLSRA